MTGMCGNETEERVIILQPTFDWGKLENEKEDMHGQQITNCQLERKQNHLAKCKLLRTDRCVIYVDLY